MNNFVCNYAIARFRPYRETGEFVIVLLKAEQGSRRAAEDAEKQQ